MRDTPPEITEKMNEMINKKSPEGRLRMGASMHATSKFLIIRAIKEENPDISEVDLKKEVFLRFYGSDFDPETREKILKHIEKNG